LQGFYDIIEEVEAQLPVFITIDPSYKPFFRTISQRLAFVKYKKEATNRAQDYKRYLKIFNAQQLGVDLKFVGLPGSPTIVYKVEKIPKAKASRKAEIVDGSDSEQIRKVVTRIRDVLGGMMIR
jgi:electron transfer flavoprotein beta subunit